MTQFTHLVASLGIAAIAAATFTGCGQPLPPEFRRVVSPCLDLPGIMATGQDALQRLLDADFVNKDLDHDGTLTFAEVQRAGNKRPNIIDPELFVTFDTARQGKLTQAQVHEGAGLLYNWAQRYRYRFLSRFDSNNDGQLILGELPSALRISQSVFDQADADRSGGLDATEFLDLVLSLNAGNECVPKTNNGQPGTSATAARQPAPVVNGYPQSR